MYNKMIPLILMKSCQDSKLSNIVLELKTGGM